MSLRNAMGKQAPPTEKKEAPQQHLQTPTAGETAHRGKRGNDGYTQLNVQIPKSLKLKFKSITSLQDSDMSEVVEGLIEDWLSRQVI